jgi:cob(I)alamin adenosyltransferase
MIDLESVLATFARKPVGLHVAVTGRGAPEKLLNIADMVTEMRMIKHHYPSGIKAQKGVEF